MNYNNCEINVLVKGRKVHEFKSPMDFQHYVEGRDGSEFEIEFVNNNAFDVEATISIDGLSITDGKAAGAQSSGYVVNGRSRVSIPGWMVDGSTAARFAFSGAKGGGYVDQIGGVSLNKGVIGAKVYQRKVLYYYPKGGFQTFDDVARGMMPMRSGIRGGMSSSVGDAVSSATTLNATSLTASASYEPTSMMESYEAPVVEQTLGTAFGEATTFNTKTVNSERGDMLAMIVLYYDDAQGLKRRGIDVSRREVTRPVAFPADEVKGATPPAGWQNNKDQKKQKRYLVTVTAAAEIDGLAVILRGAGVTVEQVMRAIGVIAIKADSSELSLIAHMHGVKAVEEDTTVTTQ